MSDADKIPTWLAWLFFIGAVIGLLFYMVALILNSPYLLLGTGLGGAMAIYALHKAKKAVKH